jgi:TetR/AcrR family transcriptional regulator, ethionamide resistance regulator
MSELAAPRLIGDRRAPGRGDAQRARLIASVVELLHSTTIAELSVMQIAKHAGVTRPVFYFYFESKYAVLAAALGQVWDEFAAARPAFDRLDLSRPPQEITRDLTGRAVAIWHRHSALITAVVEARSSDQQLALQWDELLGQTNRQLCQLIGLLESAGRARPVSDDLPGLVDAMFGMTVWSLLTGGGIEDADRRDRLVEVISAVWLASVWGPPA